MATHEISTIPFLDRILSIVDRSHLTTCDWTDMFCDCRDLGTIHCLETEEDLCFRHYVMRLAERPAPAIAAGMKKPVASVGVDGQAVRFGD
jgi:hypothetical protein